MKNDSSAHHDDVYMHSRWEVQMDLLSKQLY